MNSWDKKPAGAGRIASKRYDQGDRATGLRRRALHALWLVLSLLVFFALPASSQELPANYGSPYRLLEFNGNFPVQSYARTKDEAVQGAYALLTSQYGSDVSYVKSVYQDGHFVDVTISCHLRVEYYDPTTHEYMARISYDEEGDGTDCFYDHAYVMVYPSQQTYDIGKNLGACDCDGGIGHDGASPPGSVHQGDPINAATGNKYEQETDYVSPAGWLTFRRFYNSSPTEVAGSVGLVWRHSFDRSLQIVSDTSIILSRPDGRVERFARQADASWKADADTTDRLTEQKDANGAVAGYTVVISATMQIESYSTDGLLLSVTNQDGTVTSLTYSDASTPASTAPRAGLLISVIDPHERRLGLSYDDQARLIGVSTPGGASLSYAYDALGKLTSVTYADGKTRQYVYDEASLVNGATLTGLLTGTVDEKNIRFDSTTYNSDSKATATSKVGGVDGVTVAYGSGQSVVTTALGASSWIGFKNYVGVMKVSANSAPCGVACNQPWKSATYDANGYPASTTDFNGVVTQTTYDANGFLSTRIDASGTDAQRSISETWDVSQRAILSRTVSDAQGAVVAKNTWTRNDRGQITAECVTDPGSTTAYTCGSQTNAPPGVRQTAYTYCDAVDGTTCPLIGLRLTVDGPRTNVADITHYAYYVTSDESGCEVTGGACHRAGDLYQVIDATGHASTVAAYDKDGRISRRKNVNGVITDMTYTPRGWMASRIIRARADGVASSDDAATTFAYDATGALLSVTDPDGVTIRFVYDDAHRLIDVADDQGNHVHYTLDVAGNRLKEETFDANGASRRVLSRKYNALGQLVSTTDGLGHVVFDATANGSYDLNGKLVKARDALGTFNKTTYDPIGRIASSIANADGYDTATANTTTSYAFDAMDQLRLVTDPDGLITKYAFDGLANPVGQVSPDSGSQSATFDAAGNALSQTDARGTVVTLEYDALNRRTSSSYTDASLNVAYHYGDADDATGCVGSFPSNQLTRVVEASVTTTFCYDREGRVTEKRQTQAGVTDVTNYVYTKAGRLAAVASPSGLVTEYGYDPLGRIVTVTVARPGGATIPVVTSATYLPFGPVSTYTLGNGQTVSRAYDANYQVSEVTSPALNLHFTRDAMGNIIALSDAPNGSPATETYRYDPLYRLSAVNDPSGKAIEAYTYSRTGDRLSKTAPGLATGTYGYTPGTHWLSSVGTASRTYDANGSMTGNASAGAAWGYGYNLRKRMTVLQQGGATVATYAYNAFNQRLSKTTGASVQRFGYGLSSELLGEYGAASRDYVWMEGLPVAVVDSGSSSEGINFIHADALGTPRAVSDSSGAVIWSWAFKGNPFGEAMPTSSSGYVFNLRFPGQYFDAESGLNYNVNRDYEAATGRFLQSDPTGIDDGTSTYDYVHSSPLQSVDPTGLEAVQVPSPAPSFPSTPGTGRVPGFGPAANEPFIPPGAIGAVCGRVLGVVGALWPNTTSACDQPYPPSENNCPGNDDRCAKAKAEAQSAYWKLMTKRIPQFQTGGTRGRDPNHLTSILQLQSRLRDAIRRVILYCKPTPAELDEWERSANLNAPGF